MDSCIWLFNSQAILKLRFLQWTSACPRLLRMTQKTWASASVNNQVRAKPPAQVPQKIKGSGMKENGLSTSLALWHCSEHAIHVLCPSLRKESTRGSQIKIEWTCLNNHHGRWASCPDARGLPENNLLVSAATLFSGTTFTEVHEWASILNLQLLKKTQYYSIQSNYLIPVIHFAYKDHHNNLIRRLMRAKTEGESIELCGDARTDSPGEYFFFNTIGWRYWM